MELDEARRQAAALFEEIRPPTNRDLVEVGRREGVGLGFVEQLQAITPAGFPLPQLLHFGFTHLLQMSAYGPEEKMLWGICFDFRGATFGFEHRKFGLRALCERRNLDAPILNEIVGRARALTNVAEAYLTSGYGTAQLAAGRFTMQNLYNRLDDRYRFLRSEAEAAYSKPPPPPVTHTSNSVVCTEHDYSRPDREGGALAAAAVDAYFSRQEHLFCLSAAFTDSVPPEGTLEFLGGNWRTKARVVLDLQNSSAKTFYDRLVGVRDEWRNPLAHGGFLSGGASLYFHVSGVGALPMRLRRTPAGAVLGFALPRSSFSEIMTLFDSFDAFLKGSSLRFPVKWAESGLDLSFAPESTAAYRLAMQSESDFDALLEQVAYQQDRSANMDF
ncbi:MAG: hypothetical protein HYY93_13220 [Planctomycetes bacterium]|nr:hypothetical protein [Planctomycetota bacterium]